MTIHPPRRSGGKIRKRRLAIVVSHPIQHFVHFYRAIAESEEIDLKLFFCSRIGVKPYFDREMRAAIQWANDMTGGFAHEFLPEADDIGDTRFWSVNNPGVGAALTAFAPDIVLLYGYAQLTPLRVLLWCRNHGVPSLMITDSNAVSRRPLLKRLLRAAVLRPLLSQVSGFLTAGDQNELALRRLGVPADRMYRTPFTIDEQRYRRARNERATRRTAIRREFGIGETSFVGICVGKVLAFKRFADAAEAFARADRLSGGGGAHLILCGSGPDLERITQTVRDRNMPVTLAGFVNVDRLPDVFCAADVLVHPSERDAHPLICSEAACIGLPMILSDMVGAIGRTDIARIGENTLVHRCGDVDGLTEMVARLQADHEAREAMSRQSLRIFEECSLPASLAGLLAAVRATAAAGPAA